MAYQVKWMPNAQSQRKEILHYGLQCRTKDEGVDSPYSRPA